MLPLLDLGLLRALTRAWDFFELADLRVNWGLGGITPQLARNELVNEFELGGVIFVKRLFDIFVSGVALVLLFVPMIFIGWKIRQKLGSPIFFTQLRPGLNGQVFEMIKFRSMTSEQTLDGQLLPDSERLTHFGRFLRDYSLDELPELWNVLKGDMSLVGPRPLLKQYLPLYSPEQARRHEVRPGITGWAQVNGRNSISWDDKFALDVWYVDHKNLWLDIRILWLTVRKVLARDGINAAGDATMPKFTGNQ